MLKYVKGDVTNPQSRNIDLIVQCVNGSYKMGSGVAKAIMDKWPIVRESYMAQKSLELGSVHYVNVSRQEFGGDHYMNSSQKTWVANLVGQPDVRSKDLPVPIDYPAFRRGFEDIADWAAKTEKHGWTVSIAMPRIGCGLAGGEWSTVEMIIREKLKDFPVTVFDFD